MKKIRLLEVVPSLSLSNGVAAYISNYFQNMDLNKFDVTFLVVRNIKNKGRYKEIKEKGGKIHELYFEKNIIKYSEKVDNYFKNNNYDIIHCNVANVAFIILKYAKKHNIPVRIMHSHGTISSDRFANRIRNDVLIKIGKKYANEYFACSMAAGKAMFGNKDFYVVNNAINYEKYYFDEDIRKKCRKELNIDDKIVVGTIGRSVPQKNHKYLIKVFSKVVENNGNMILIIIGGGPLDNKLQKLINELKLQDYVKLLGNREDAYKLYNAMDLFVLPSLYEGLPVVGIEAQVNGLNCIMSDKITEEVNFLNKCKFISINNRSINLWKNEILKTYSDRSNYIYKRYEISHSCKQFEKKLIETIEKRK